MHLHRDESGLAGTILVIVIAWALAAVLMLTGTLIAARQIDDRVAFITGEVGDIKADTRLVELTNDTVDTSGSILEASQPLSEQLDQVNVAANSIDGTVDEILATAGSINGTVTEINSTVGELEPIVFQINDRAKSIGGSVNAINQSAGGIQASVNNIQPGVVAINGRADEVIGLVQGIKGDTGTILAIVSSGEPGNLGIRGHANSIDCSPAVRPTSTHCQPGEPGGGTGGGAAPLPDDLFGDLLGGNGGLLE